jgi:hypothetical protein
MKENNKEQKIYCVWRREEVHYEYHVKANSIEEAKLKVEEGTYDSDGYGHLVNDYYEVWQDGESVFDIHEIDKEFIDEDKKILIKKITDDYCETQYPFEDGDTYYTIEDGEWIESTWDSVSEEIHDEKPNIEYYTEPNKESKLQ